MAEGYYSPRSVTYLTPTERRVLALTIAGEIDPSKTKYGTDLSRREIAQILETIETRFRTNNPAAFGTTRVRDANTGVVRGRLAGYGDRADVALQSKQFSTWNKPTWRDNAKGNYSLHQKDIDKAIDDYFSGILTPEISGTTHYKYVPKASKTWVLPTAGKVGPHTFYRNTAAVLSGKANLDATEREREARRGAALSGLPAKKPSSGFVSDIASIGTSAPDPRAATPVGRLPAARASISGTSAKVNPTPTEVVEAATRIKQTYFPGKAADDKVSAARPKAVPYVPDLVRPASAYRAPPKPVSQARTTLPTDPRLSTPAGSLPATPAFKTTSTLAALERGKDDAVTPSITPRSVTTTRVAAPKTDIDETLALGKPPVPTVRTPQVRPPSVTPPATAPGQGLLESVVGAAKRYAPVAVQAAKDAGRAMVAPAIKAWLSSGNVERSMIAGNSNPSKAFEALRSRPMGPTDEARLSYAVRNLPSPNVGADVQAAIREAQRMEQIRQQIAYNARTYGGNGGNYGGGYGGYGGAVANSIGGISGARYTGPGSGGYTNRSGGR